MRVIRMKGVEKNVDDNEDGGSSSGDKGRHQARELLVKLSKEKLFPFVVVLSIMEREVKLLELCPEDATLLREIHPDGRVARLGPPQLWLITFNERDAVAVEVGGNDFVR